MDNPIKKVAVIHDLSGYGRTSIAAITPILSYGGIQVCPFPTAVLSNNTGYFDDFSIVDLTDSMVDYMKHWEKENIVFDCIYSGFLACEKQVDIILSFIRIFGTSSNMIVVDPVLGDHGKLYPTIDENMVNKMKSLVGQADIITPNFTEAIYLLGKKYTRKINESEIKKMLVELSDLGPKIVIITSVPSSTCLDYIDVFAYDKENNEFWQVACEHIPVEFPGTGDIFASVLIESLLNGSILPMSIDKSVQFISAAIEESIKYSYPKKEGVLLEKVLCNLKNPVKNTTFKLLK